MFGMTGLNELLIIMLVIAILSMTGLWPMVIRGLRELRGEHIPEPAKRSADKDLFFQLLGISPSASWEEIEKAYRKKAKVHHPDHGGDGDTMRVLNEIYAQLKKTRRG